MSLKNVLSWDSTDGYKMTGSCELTCTASALSATGDASASGTLCSYTIYGNDYTAVQLDALIPHYCWDPNGNSGSGQSVLATAGSTCCVVNRSCFFLLFTPLMLILLNKFAEKK